MPFPQKVAEIVLEFQPEGASFHADLARFLNRRYGVSVPPDAWDTTAVPAHLRLRFELVSNDRKVLVAGRDLVDVKARLQSVVPKPSVDPQPWRDAARRWERPALTQWNFGDLPEKITVVEDPLFPLLAWPGLELEGSVVNLRLFRSADAARTASLPAFQRLVELALSKDLGWIEKDLRGLSRADSLYVPLGGPSELRESSLRHLRRHLLPSTVPVPLTLASFEEALSAARQRIPGLVPRFIDQVVLVLQALQTARARIGAGTSGPAAASSGTKTRTLNDLSQLGALLGSVKTVPTKGTASASGAGAAGRPPTLAEELGILMPPTFLDSVEHEQLKHLPRYLKALALRAERAANNPTKDAERVRQVWPYQQALERLRAEPPKRPDAAARVDEFRWLLEEFKVSVFAQELGTNTPVSSKRLDTFLESLR
jgi:ATP-dependent helicase HrpA